MTKKSLLKKNISTAFNEKRFKDAFEALFTLEPYELYGSLDKNKWLSDREIAHFFWGRFCIEKYDVAFQQRFADIVLHWYLKDLNNQLDGLNNLLVKSHPKEFLTAIKRSRSFLNAEFNEKTKALVWTEEFNIEILAQIELEKLYASKLKRIDICCGYLSSLVLHEILCGLIIWIDRRYYAQHDGMEEKLYWVYNFALSFLSTKIKKTRDVDLAEFETIFGNLLKSKIQQHIEFFAEAIEDWLDFETTILTSYCFDDNYEAKLSNGQISFGFKSAEEHHAWKNDTLRYLVNEKRYLKCAAHFYDLKDAENEIVIPGKNELDVNDNLHLFLHEKKTQFLLKDLKIDKFKSGNKTLDAHKVITGLTGYSKNRQIRYVIPMLELSLNNTPWLDSVFYIANKSSKEGVGNTPLPFMFTKLDDLIKTYQSAIDNFDATEIRAMINHFSQTYTEKFNFNPFNLSFNMLETPFLKIGDYVLMPTTLFATNNWFFSFSQRALHLYANQIHNEVRKRTSSEMEKFLDSIFKTKGWSSRCITPKEADRIDGDVDVFVNDGKTQLLIQLKRTKLKLDLESNYRDSLLTDLKASGQLNAAVHSLQNNVIPELEIMDKHHLWIVTTSFEGVLTKVDGCKKVNYFDLIWTLRFANITSVDDLVAYISADRPFLENLKLLDIPL